MQHLFHTVHTHSCNGPELYITALLDAERLQGSFQALYHAALLHEFCGLNHVSCTVAYCHLRVAV